MNLLCPGCQQILQGPEDCAGQQMRCPLCNATFLAPFTLRLRDSLRDKGGGTTTETAWPSCEDPVPMLRHLEPSASNRKLELFALACCQRVRSLLPEEARVGLDLAERAAAGLFDPNQRSRSRAAAMIVLLSAARGCSWGWRGGTLEATQAVAIWARDIRAMGIDEASETALLAAQAAIRSAVRVAGGAVEAVDAAWTTWQAERAAQADLLRDLFGNPWRPAAVDVSWLTWNNGCVPKMAHAIYEERRFEDLPVLADALEEAGCANTAILDHCRGAGLHARGCWGLDSLLGQT